VFLSGGLDSLSLLAPVGHPEYVALRPSLAVPGDGALTFSEDTSLQWHPMAAPLRDLHAGGKVTVIPAIGYTDPNQSHFTSRHYWEVGKVDPFGRSGWLGRYLDRHGVSDNPLQGLSLNSTLAPSLAPDAVPVAAVSNPESYSLGARDVWDTTLRNRLNDGFGALGSLATGDTELAVARQATRLTAELRARLAPIQGINPYTEAQVAYPTGNQFPRRLAALAEMIELGLPLRCVAITANGGYDTHDNQAGSLPNDISLLARSLKAFQDDLEARGVADRVLVHVWSEFGRRAQENGTGTDHGAGGLSLVLGTSATGTMVGEFPGLSSGELDSGGNLRHTTDFRGVYRGLMEQWFGVDADGIVPNAGSFTAPTLVT